MGMSRKRDKLPGGAAGELELASVPGDVHAARCSQALEALGGLRFTQLIDGRTGTPAEGEFLNPSPCSSPSTDIFP